MRFSGEWSEQPLIVMAFRASADLKGGTEVRRFQRHTRRTAKFLTDACASPLDGGFGDVFSPDERQVLAAASRILQTLGRDFNSLADIADSIKSNGSATSQR